MRLFGTQDVDLERSKENFKMLGICGGSEGSKFGESRLESLKLQMFRFSKRLGW